MIYISIFLPVLQFYLPLPEMVRLHATNRVLSKAKALHVILERNKFRQDFDFLFRTTFFKIRATDGWVKDQIEDVFLFLLSKRQKILTRLSAWNWASEYGYKAVTKSSSIFSFEINALTRLHKITSLLLMLVKMDSSKSLRYYSRIHVLTQVYEAMHHSLKPLEMVTDKLFNS